MLKPLLLLGAGNFALEVADLVRDMQGFDLAGLVQNIDPQKRQTTLDGLPVWYVDQIRDLAGTHWAACAIGAAERRGLVEQVAELGFRFATLVHPGARISATSRLGEGTIVSPGAIVAAHTTVGRHVILNRGALIGHHSAIGDYATIGPGANIAGSVAIGESTFVGIGAIVSDHLTIGARAFLTAGAVVTKDVADGERVRRRP